MHRTHKTHRIHVGIHFIFLPTKSYKPEKSAIQYIYIKITFIKDQKIKILNIKILYADKAEKQENYTNEKPKKKEKDASREDRQQKYLKKRSKYNVELIP